MLQEPMWIPGRPRFVSGGSNPKFFRWCDAELQPAADLAGWIVIRTRVHYRPVL